MYLVFQCPNTRLLTRQMTNDHIWRKKNSQNFTTRDPKLLSWIVRKKYNSEMKKKKKTVLKFPKGYHIPIELEFYEVCAWKQKKNAAPYCTLYLKN